MATRFTFEVEVEANRTEGKFATRDELAEQIQQAIEDANPNSLTGDNGGEYSVDSWEVSETAHTKRK
jgi:hypothetical protein